MKSKKTSEMVYVAYAEDHLLVRETIVSFLEAQGEIKFIIQADNGKELLEKIKQSNIKPHVCIVDIVMPEMNGFETVSKLRADGSSMKILVLSGHLSEGFFIEMLLAGSHGYLTKNQSPQDIKKAILDVHHFGVCNMEHVSSQFLKRAKKECIDKIKTPLSGKELQLLKLSIEDKTYDDIAEKMGLTSKSVEGHRKRLFDKLGVKTRAGLVMYAVQYGYVLLNIYPKLNSSTISEL
jgi:two-component system invasion response regulator UvrY